MKSNNVFRTKGHDRESEDTTKKAVKLPPIKKSGKERHELYGSLDDEDDDTSLGYRRRESALDYFDDMEDGKDPDDQEPEDGWEEEYDDEEEELE